MFPHTLRPAVVLSVSLLVNSSCGGQSPASPTTTSPGTSSPTTTSPTTTPPVTSPGGTGGASGAWLTALPFDLALVAEMSRFRSCTGHDFSGFNINSEAERDRSMKHYVTLSIPWTPSDVMRLHSPFDGTVRVVRTGGPPGQAIDIESDAGTPWMFFFAHVTPLVRVGDRVRAGDPVATVPPTDFMALGPALRPTVAFDTGLESVINGGPAYESYFVHMTGGVLAQFAARGFTPEKLVVPKAERDAAPCTQYNRSDGVDYVRASG